MNSQRGYSLVELMVVLFLFSLIGIAAASTFQLGEAETHEARIKLGLQETVRDGLQKMSMELRQTALGRVTVDSASRPHTITFQIPASVSNVGAITWSNPIRYSVGGVQGRQLIRTDLGTGVATVLANDVVDLIAYVIPGVIPGEGSIHVTLDARRSSLKGRELREFDETWLVLRNA